MAQAEERLPSGWRTSWPTAEEIADHARRPYGEIYTSPGAVERRRRGRPGAELPNISLVLEQLATRNSIRQIAAALGVPKNRIERVRQMANLRTPTPEPTDAR